MIPKVMVGALAAVAIWYYYRKLPFHSTMKIWQIGLLVSVLIYVGFVMLDGAWIDLPKELMGVFVYSFFILLSQKSSPYFLAFGCLLHVLWDLIIHPTGIHPYVPEWYPPVCLGFAIAIAAFLFTRILQQQKRT